MGFSVQDFHDLIRLLEAHPEWRAELRRLVLTEELLELPQLFRELAAKVAALVEAQARTEEQVARLAETQARTEDQLRRLEEGVTQVEGALTRLAEAQARTEERVGRLEEAVARLDERVTRLEEAMVRLAEAQARTEERVGRLEEAVARLAEAQARTGEQVAGLEERTSRLEEAVARLAEAQARTEEQVGRLAIGLEKLRQEVGQLSNTVGATAEEEAVSVLLAVLRDKGFQPLDEPTSVTVDGREVDLVVPVRTAAGEVLWAVVDVKLRLSPNHIRDWSQRISSEGFRRQLRGAGVPGPYLVYSYGLRILLGVPDAARTWRVGLLTPRGELITPPAPVEPAA